MSWAQPSETADTPVVFEWEDEVDLKLQYARAVYDCGADWRMAGYRVFQGTHNIGRGMQAANWINDPIVVIELSRLRNDGEAEEAMPITRAGLAKRVLDRANAEDKTKDAVAAYELVAKLLDYMPKATQNLHVGDNIVQNVLRVPERAVDKESFADRFRASQTKLVADARSARSVN
jgi:hypothetical protein